MNPYSSKTFSTLRCWSQLWHEDPAGEPLLSVFSVVNASVPTTPFCLGEMGLAQQDNFMGLCLAKKLSDSKFLSHLSSPSYFKVLSQELLVSTPNINPPHTPHLLWQWFKSSPITINPPFRSPTLNFSSIEYALVDLVYKDSLDGLALVEFEFNISSRRLLGSCLVRECKTTPNTSLVTRNEEGNKTWFFCQTQFTPLIAEGLAIKAALAQVSYNGKRNFSVKSEFLQMVRAINNGSTTSKVYGFLHDNLSVSKFFDLFHVKFISKIVNCIAQNALYVMVKMISYYINESFSKL
ncbi:hypothetical protein AALP_AA6G223200 [Arabis alpina]|uniref:RNase H type-1 domain-containing protein n=1 Tax=Arabis alpina TaxID=50452 RepID=A0A087GQY8_ARAAL|nr:hypothetical protein AALP_AA6G223200 [Arabis alpina]